MRITSKTHSVRKKKKKKKENKQSIVQVEQKRNPEQSNIVVITLECTMLNI